MTSPDPRPADCHFRLRDEHKPFPKSACTACGATVATGLGKQCPQMTSPAMNDKSGERVDEYVRVPRDLIEEARDMLRVYERSRTWGATADRLDVYLAASNLPRTS